MSFVKLDCGILDSSIWSEPPEIIKVWFTLLAMARPNGLVEAAAPGIARRALLPLEVVETALDLFEAPDRHSRSLAAEGRRIERVDGGYLVITYEKHRAKDHTAPERARRYRARLSPASTATVTRDDRDERDASHKQKQKQKQKQRTEQTSAPAAGVEPSVPITSSASWLKPYGDAWEARYGGRPNYGHLAKALSALHHERGAAIVLAHWQNYLAATEPRFAKVENFVTTFGSWAAPALAAAGRKPTANELSLAAAGRFAARRDGGACG